MKDWIEASERLPTLGAEDRSALVEFKAGNATFVGFLVREWGGLKWVSQDGETWIPEPRPAGLAEPQNRWVSHWREL